MADHLYDVAQGKNREAEDPRAGTNSSLFMIEVIILAIRHMPRGCDT